MKEERNIRSLIVTIGLTAISLFFCAPAVIVEVYSWIPRSLLSTIPYRYHSSLGGVVGLAWTAVVVTKWIYLSISFVLNIILLFRKQAPAWLKLLLWIPFIIAIFGVIDVVKDLNKW